LHPEGTREKVTSLKTGFYYIALKAKCSYCCFFDFGKEVNLGAPLLPTGNIKKEMEILLNHYKDVLVNSKRDIQNKTKLQIQNCSCTVSTANEIKMILI
jgi:hypothetical protein